MRFQKKRKEQTGAKNRIVVDTSALIDGRILKLAESGFLRGSELIVTNIILDEMQYLADEGGSLKRGRARFGFEVLNTLRDTKGVWVVNQDLDKSELEVDVQLLKHAQKLKAQLFTVDFNLTQRARAEGVLVANPAELADALKPEILPGETFTVKLVQKGDGRDQAVGYLDDGTMVVAEKASKMLGEKVELLSTKIIQTDGGRIVFADILKKGRLGARTNSGAKAVAPRARKSSALKPRTSAKPQNAGSSRAKTTVRERVKTNSSRTGGAPSRDSRPARSINTRPRNSGPRPNQNGNRGRRINHKQRAEDELMSALQNSN